LEYSAKELVDMEFAPLEWIIPNFLTEGLCVLGGKPKQGKTLLSIGLAFSVTAGEDLNGKSSYDGGEAVYISLEDNYRLFKERIKRMDESKGLSEASQRGLHVYFEFPRFDEGGLDTLKRIIKNNSDVRLIVIDPLVNFKPIKGNGYESDYKYLKELKGLADRHGIAILLVHHLKKSRVSDAIDGFSGSVGITGAADNLMLLKKYNADLSELLMIGKNIHSTSYAMKLNDGVYWDVVGEIEEIQKTEGLQKIYDLFKEHPDVVFTPKEIAGACGLKVGYVKKKLPQFLQRGDIERVEYGQYRFLEKYPGVPPRVPDCTTTVQPGKDTDKIGNIDEEIMKSTQSTP